MRPVLAAAVVFLVAGCAAPGPLRVIDNVLAHEGAPPPSPPQVRELLARPLAALDAEASFERGVPAALRRLAEPRAGGTPVPLETLIGPYLDELAAAQRALRAALPRAPTLTAELPPPQAQRELAASVDPQVLQRAVTLFLEATGRLLRQPIVFPSGGARFERGDIVIVVGTTGDDVHELSPLRDSAIRVILEPGGDDHYRGPDLVVGGFSAIIDLRGNDRYEADGPAWGAAIAGASLLLDFSGDDTYEARDFAQGAALAGLGVLLDLQGNDRYRLRAFGQGLGLARGTGILWDRAGDDRYLARGLADPYDRGGGLSFAQGAAVGVRTGMGGGIGLLRDDAGDDVYEAQLYAQGAAYYYALGVLWDRAGNDRYGAARYAQGAGVHQAVGVLRDDAGDDSYELSVGVGQGMGLDLAVGVLADAAGNDRYRAPTLAQGSATANGVGIVFDSAGRNEWHLRQPPGRGTAEWSRGLPSVGLVLADAPAIAMPVKHEPEGDPACPPETGEAPAAGTLAGALRLLGPGFGGGALDAGAYALALRELRTRPAEALASLPLADFDVLWPLGVALGCALRGASEDQAQRVWDAFETLVAQPASPLAGIVASALRARPAPGPQMRRLLERLAAHPSCGVRTSALALDGSAASAQEALRSSCWQLQARALRILAERGAAPWDLSAVPRFLRPATARASLRAP